ncbi:unnamed protein product [uncultured bacterium]|nr:unnamed protein product [uncultured bacterium]
MLVRLTRKFSEAIDGVDLSGRAVGDRLDLPQHDAELLIAEGWATPVAPKARRMRSQRAGPFVKGAFDGLIRHDFLQPSLGAQQRRRAEDRIRDALRDSRSKTITKNHDVL